MKSATGLAGVGRASPVFAVGEVREKCIIDLRWVSISPGIVRGMGRIPAGFCFFMSAARGDLHENIALTMAFWTAAARVRLRR